MCHTNETDMLSNTSTDCQNICDTVLWWKKLKNFLKEKKNITKKINMEKE